MSDGFSIDDYDYDLPQELIAQKPPAQRGDSRLLRVDRSTGAPTHHGFQELPALLEPGDLLVMNRSRVLPARLRGRRSGGGAAEVLLVRKRDSDLWEAMVRPGRRLHPGSAVQIAPDFLVQLEEATATGGGEPSGPIRLVRLVASDGDADAAIQRHGHVPLPPYIHRPDGPADRERYQTVYAREAGSIAAPTAGLHFTPELLQTLRKRGVQLAELVLHVGPGTFRPVEAEDIRAHRVDPEVFSIPEETAAAIARARREGRRVIGVGTTTARALESAVAPGGNLRSGAGETALVICPGHAFNILGGLLTNFHLPRSSLLLLVSAFAQRETVLAAYEEAVRRRYRFYSYGDAMLVL